MDNDPLVSVTLPTLRALVAKTPFKPHEFERLIGWDFSKSNAPQSKRALAWKVLQLSPGQLETLYNIQKHFPKAWIVGIRDGDGS